jgi:glutamyl-tRNA reductase
MKKKGKMKKILKQIINSIINFLNKMADQEAQRLIELYQQISKG